MRWLEVEFAGKKVRVPAMKNRGRLWFHWQGQTYVMDAPGTNQRVMSERGQIQSGQIVAPMPGKVTKVSVQKGDSVVKGQALVVMEAMKMEYTLESDCDGKVDAVCVAPGAQVGLGELLVRVIGP